MYASELLIEPVPAAGAVYHVSRPESLSLPIHSVTVNGREFPYRIEQGLLKLDAAVAPGVPALAVAIRYGDPASP
jgi:hypothetical protein